MPARSSSARPTCRSSPGASSARTRGTAPSTTRSTRGRRRAVPRPGTPPRSRPGSSTSGSEPTPAARSASRRRPAARWASSPAGATSRSTACSRCVPTLDTVGPMGRSVEDVALLWSVLSGLAMPEPRLEGLTVGLLRRAPAIGDGRETEASDAADDWVADLERLGARVVEARCRRAGDMWPLFLHEAAQSHRATFPSRAAEYGPVIRPKLEAGLLVEPTRSQPPTTRCTTGGAPSPRSTSTSARASASTCRTRMPTRTR